MTRTLMGLLVDTADLTEYDLSGAKPVRFEFQKKEVRVNMRLPELLLEAIPYYR